MFETLDSRPGLHVDLARVERACRQACASIAPTWPLDQAIAVNPHWERVGLPVRQVAARMAVLGGMRVFPSRTRLRQAWEEGRIRVDDVQQALADVDAARVAGMTAADWLAEMQRDRFPQRLPLLIDVLDRRVSGGSLLPWPQAIAHQVSQTCAAFFDEHQADWCPSTPTSLYDFWRDTLAHDHGIGVLMGIPDLGQRLNALPRSRQEAEAWVLARLGLPEAAWADYLEAVLLTVNGWASWCAYLSWQDRLEPQADSHASGHLRDLLAIRLAWGALVLDGQGDQASQRSFESVKAAWHQVALLLAKADAELVADEVGQCALEVAYQRDLVQRLSSAGQATTAAPTIEVQAAFCIDVRSEPMRRAVEAAHPGMQTIGFAGFFGLPMAYTPLATQARRPQLPGLLAPTVNVSERPWAPQPTTQATEPDPAAATGGREGLLARVIGSRQAQFERASSWNAATRWPGSAYSFVEAAGWSYLGKLGGWLMPSADKARERDDLYGLAPKYHAVCRPVLLDLDVDARTELASRVLHAMGLDDRLAPLVVLVGHGSQSANNAHAAALDCGACCGQTGEVNARVLAQLLNDGAVRAGLMRRGLHIPAHTVFLAALHNTTTDELEWFDTDLLPADAHAPWKRVEAAFVQAGDQVRRERASSLALDPRAPQGKLMTDFKRRANDGAQTRPEWGLAGNAAFLIAPRERSAATTLSGRAFLHDYDARRDEDGSVLELLMTAPMLVTHWINWQYHASTCEPDRLGSGNKVLHNVVGGRLGVFEGNGGDLRIGLSRQSLHDGTRWMHEPLRLTVLIDAPAGRIADIVSRHAVVRHLVDHHWLHLWRFADAGGFERYVQGAWQPLKDCSGCNVLDRQTADPSGAP
jgi:uncharacterized protein YbcC (UPF0753/DUF2309 family)